MLSTFVRAKRAASAFEASRLLPQLTRAQAEPLRLNVHGRGREPVSGCEVVGAEESANPVAPITLGVDIFHPYVELEPVR